MSAVPRETAGGAPPPPRAARELFGGRIDLARRYGDLLAGPGTQRGLLGPREVPRLWDRHLLNCAVIHEAIPDGADVVDVGSGAGLPGVVLALLRPDLSVTLVEPMLRRSVFLEETVGALELENTVVVRARIEELRGRMDVDVVTARAVAPLTKLVRWTMPVLRPGGMLVAVKGESAMSEVEAAGRELQRGPVASWEIRTFGSGAVEPPTRAVVVVREAAVGQAGAEPRGRWTAAVENGRERAASGSAGACDGSLGWPELDDGSADGDRLGWPDDAGSESESSEADDDG